MMEFLISHRRLREEIFSRLLSDVLASVQDSVQKEMGLGLEGLRQQLSEMIATSVESSTQQAPDLARTQVGTGEQQHCNSTVPPPHPPPFPFAFKPKGRSTEEARKGRKKLNLGGGIATAIFCSLESACAEKRSESSSDLLER